MGSGTSGFALGSPDGAVSGQKRVFRQFFGGFWLQDKQDVPGNQEAANQRLSLAQAWPLYIHTIGGTEGCHFWSKKGFFWLTGKQDVPGVKQEGGPS